MSTTNGAPKKLRPAKELSLPPEVEGSIKGETLLHISGLKAADGPLESQTLQIRLQWWGDTGAGTLLQLNSGAGTIAARFPIRCSAGLFQQYLQDMECLALSLEDRFSGMLGEAALQVGKLSEHNPLAGTIYFVQWPGSDEERCIATAQLRLLLSFTPIPAHASTPAPPDAGSETGYLSNSSGSSEGLSSASPPSEEEQSAELASKDEAAPEPPKCKLGTQEEGTSSARVPRRHLKQAPRRMTAQRAVKNEAGHDQKERPPSVRSAAANPAQQSSITLDMTPSYTHSDQIIAPAPEDKSSALTVPNAQSSSRPKQSSAQAETVFTGMPCLAPERAISRLIERAEQLREMIGVTGTDSSPRASAARISTSDLQHASVAATSPVTCVCKLQHGTAGMAEPAQALHDAKSVEVRQKRVNERAAPASELRRLAQARLQTDASSPQGVLNSPQAQGSGATAGVAEAAYSRRLYKDAACQTLGAPRHCIPEASQSDRVAQCDTAAATSACLDACKPGPAAQAVAVRKLEGFTKELRGVRRAACEPQEVQQGLLRAQSAPASLLAMHCLRALPVRLQSPSHAHRQSSQHATSQAPVPAMLRSSAAGSKMKRKLRMPSSEPRTPKCSERPAWQSSFKPARHQPAARKSTPGSKPVPGQHASPPPAGMSAHSADAPVHVAASSVASQVAGEGENAGACTQDDAGNATDVGNAFGAIWRVHQQDDATSSAPFLDLSNHVVSHGQPMRTTMQLEVVQACGLLAAVNAAEEWTDGSSMLKRAKLHGPTAYACLALSPSRKGMGSLPSLTTAAQGPSFCPTFSAEQQTDVILDCNSMKTLAMQDGRVEVWAAAVPHQAPHEGYSRVPQHSPEDILLGCGTFGLQDMLTKAQGIQKWVALDSQQGSAVGAVQIRAALVQAAGTAISNHASSSPPLEQAPALQALLPPERPAQLLTGSAGFNEQPARATVEIHSALVPWEGSPARQSPKISIMYRLPGDTKLQHTPMVEAQAPSHANTSGKLRHAQFEHATAHWVLADNILVQRLLSTPLLATVLLHQRAKRGNQLPQPVPLGTAEVDLSFLLHPRLGSAHAGRRAILGMYPLIHPGAKSLHGACIHIKVSLDLDPPCAQAALLQLQQAASSRRPSMAASLPTPAQTALGQKSAASLRQNSGTGPKTGPRQQSHASMNTGPGAAAETGAGQQRRASLRPATAETSTEYFARMEALAGQAPEQTAAAAPSETAEPYGLENSPAGQLEQYPDMLQAWRRLSASIEALPEAFEGPYHTDAITPAQLDSELAQLSHAQLAAGADAAQRSAAAVSAWPRGDISMTEAELADTWGASAEAECASQLCKEFLGSPWASFGSMWDASNSPCVIMGSPDQHYSATPGLGEDPVQVMGSPDELQQQYSLYPGLETSIHLTSSPDQLWQHDTVSSVHPDPMQPAYPAEVTELSGEAHQQAWRYSAEDDVEPNSGAATSAAASPADTWQPANVAEPAPDSPDSDGACEAALQQEWEWGDRQQGHRQGFAQPLEEDLHAMMAWFQQSCARAAPTPPCDSGDDLAAMSAPAGSSLPQQQAAADCNDANTACQNLPDAPSSQVDPGADSARPAVPSHSLRQVEAEGLEPAVPGDSLQPEEAENLEEAQVPTMEEPMARLATCSDDEEFAVLDLGAASDASSDCSFGRERTAAGEHETVYAGPRGALVMPLAPGSSDEWLFGLGPSLPAAEYLLASGCQEALTSRRGDTHPGELHNQRESLQAEGAVWGASGAVHAEPEKAPCFSFTNMLPPVPADDDADSVQPDQHVVPAVPPHHADMPADRQQSADAGFKSGAEPLPKGIRGQSSSDDAAQQQASMLQHLPDAPIGSLSLPSPTAQCLVPDGPSALAPESPPNAQQLAAATEAAETVHSWLPERHVQRRMSFSNMPPQPEEQHSMSGSCTSSPCKPSTHTVSNHGADSGSQPGELSMPGSPEQTRQPPAGDSSAANMFSNVLPQPDKQQSMPSDVGFPRDVLLDEWHSRDSTASMFSNVLPQPDEQHSMPSAAAMFSNVLPQAEEQHSEETVSVKQLVVGMSRRELFRLKLAQAAQAGQAESQAAAPPTASEAVSMSATSIQLGAGLPASTESEAAAATADISAKPVSTNWNLHGSPAQNSPGASPEAAPCGDKDPCDGGPSSGVLEPALTAAASSRERTTAWPGTDDLGSSGEHDDVSALPEEASSRAVSKVEAVTPGEAGMPDEATADADTEVYWAENVAAGASEESDEALLHAIRRMSAVARERIRSNADKAPALETPDLATSLPQSAEESSEHPCLPTCDPHCLGRDFQPGTEQLGQGMGSPVRASYEQLLARFHGSPAMSDACVTPPRGSANHGTAQQGKGGTILMPGHLAAPDQVPPSSQLSSPPWQHRSPLPICSPAHAYVAGQRSPPGALGTRLRDLEPKQVLPALRALWGHDKKHPGTGSGMHGNTAAGSSPGDGSHSTSSQGESCKQQRHMHQKGSSPSTIAPETARQEKDVSKDTPAAAKQVDGPQALLTVDVEVAGRRKDWPAAKRGNVDPEADRIASIMASVRASPWQQ